MFPRLGRFRCNRRDLCRKRRMNPVRTSPCRPSGKHQRAASVRTDTQTHLIKCPRWKRNDSHACEGVQARGCCRPISALCFKQPVEAAFLQWQPNRECCGRSYGTAMNKSAQTAKRACQDFNCSRIGISWRTVRCGTFVQWWNRRPDHRISLRTGHGNPCGWQPRWPR